MEWEPLPKRARRTYNKDCIPSRTQPPAKANIRERAAPSMQEKIDAAVQARIYSERAKGSLSSKDGCAGDNYECKGVFCV